jgi:hypothetical protein
MTENLDRQKLRALLEGMNVPSPDSYLENYPDYFRELGLSMRHFLLNCNLNELDITAIGLN